MACSAEQQHAPLPCRRLDAGEREGTGRARPVRSFCLGEAGARTGHRLPLRQSLTFATALLAARRRRHEHRRRVGRWPVAHAAAAYGHAQRPEWGRSYLEPEALDGTASSTAHKGHSQPVSSQPRLVARARPAIGSMVAKQSKASGTQQLEYVRPGRLEAETLRRGQGQRREHAGKSRSP